jgi:glutamate 5-kinase
MITKLKAAGIAMSAGIKTVIAYGRSNEVISRVVKGDEVGTVFKPYAATGAARKRWIIFSKKPKGTLFIDAGAKEAILHKGKSLLGVGVSGCEGEFKDGDSVRITDSEGGLIGYGIVNYSCSQVKNAKEKRLDKEVIHRDNFVKSTGEEWHNL